MCVDNKQTDGVSLQTENLRRQLDKIKSTDSKPAVYEGETMRNLYCRSKNHWGNYNTVSGKPKSFMWHHTKEEHSSIIGPNRGKDDYKVFSTGFFRSNLQRLVDEGRRQSVMESLQSQQKVILLNSKLDFIQPMRTQITATTRSASIAQGDQKDQL